MGYVTWVLIWFLVGILMLISPIFVGPLLPAKRRTQVCDRYFKMAMAAGQRVLLARRKLGGYKLLPSSYDSEKEAETVTLGGEKKHFDDSHRFMSRAYAKPFGIVYERSTAIISPAIAEIGREFHEWLENDDHKVKLSDETGEQFTAFNRTLGLPRSSSLVDPAHILSVLPGSARPSIAETGYEYARKSQEGFNTRRMVEGMTIVIGFVAGFAIVFLAFREMGGGSLSGVNIQMMLGVMA